MADLLIDTFDYRFSPVECDVRIETVKRGLTAAHDVARIAPPPGYLEPDPVVMTGRRQEVLILIDPKSAIVWDIDGPGAVGIFEAAARHMGIGWAIGKLLDQRTDRAYYEASYKLANWLRRSGAWDRDKNDGAGHKAHAPGFNQVCSFRSRSTPSVQAVLWSRWVRDTKAPSGDVENEETVVELDIDYHRPGVKHILGEVLYNKITGSKTNPIMAAQLAAYLWPLHLPFMITPGESA